MTMRLAVIDFYKDKMLVHPPYLFSFIAWSLGQTPGVAHKLRKLCSMALFNRLGVRGVEEDRRRLLAYYSFSWARYAADGTRMQLFDAAAQTVTKVGLRPNEALIEREVRLRSGMGDACPAILACDPRRGVIVERWLNLNPLAFDLATLARAIDVLKQKLYRRHSVDACEYVTRFGDAIDQKKVKSFLTFNGVTRVDLSDVHGDLWRGNLFSGKDGNIVILDWEYCRSCVASHDIWTYLFQFHSSSGKRFDSRFLGMLSETISTCLGVRCDARAARGYHLIHLIERYVFFCSLNLSHKKEELLSLSNQISITLESQE